MAVERDLTWHEEKREAVYGNRVFTAYESLAVSPDGRRQTFSILGAPDWAIVLPLLKTADEDRFLMVRQWRHGACALSLEFPGGVVERGEDPLEGARRELQEETGRKAGSIRLLGTFSPNPAIMANTVHIFLAEDLEMNGGQHLDADEYLDVEQVPAAEVIAHMGRPPYIHALMASALCLYLRGGSGS